jgi:hypothetical protein
MVIKKTAKKKTVAKKPAKKSAKKVAGKVTKKKVAKKMSSAAKSSKAVKKKPLKAKRSGKELEGLVISQVAAIVSGYMDEQGYEPVLTGKSCAAIYAGTSIHPKTLDFIVRDFTIDEVAETMAGVGFLDSGHRTFSNKHCPYEVLLSTHPVVVGDDVVSDVKIMRTAKGSLKLLTPTDCVRQRLSMFYRWNDRGALEDALKVAQKHEIDLDIVRRWSDWEWASERYDEFVELLKADE